MGCEDIADSLGLKLRNGQLQIGANQEFVDPGVVERRPPDDKGSQ
jgi:hypothetical protein